MQDYTIHAKLKAYLEDGQYTQYVFEDLDTRDPDFKYITCVRFPRWDHPKVPEEVPGYLNFRCVEQGKDQWFDGNKLQFYNYTNIVFMKFISEKSEIELDEIRAD